ncbi:uncharacterized protein Dwil_GK14560 [Drosophila willistoni]|uniref:Uncharacterized protein n=1 Tax=Drosophila willistoni TaxID=7260 RepID=B4MWZ2_DROWI|nr:uncharacterized protein LOC6642165 [Drosophila willistoni]EDW76631.1 uncharacterized protein Dwil_GK14560 [Drosophila willistoni]
MNTFIRWVATLSGSIVVTAQTFGLLKTVNEMEAAKHMAPVGIESAIISSQLEPPANMGSEKISAALQYILSSKESELDRCPVYIEARNNNTMNDCVLGSESLNRMLEDITSPLASENSFIEPVIRV